MKKIVIEHLSKKFGKQEVLKDINLTMQTGKIYGIAGYNGSGKTVMFKCICGLMIPDSGIIRIDDKKVKKGEILTDVGMIIEGPAYLKRKSAYDNLCLLYQIRNRVDKEYLYKVLRQVGLDPVSKKPAGKFSLGMKQRLGIAQAVMEDPPFLILDEPLNGLDKNGIKEMRDFFLEMKNSGKIILMASHNKYDMEILCDELYELEAGKLVYEENDELSLETPDIKW